MKSKDIRKSFLEFFEKNNHTSVPSSSLLSGDPSVLLTTAGMQQFKPYYSGDADPFSSPHPSLNGKPINSDNTASIQKSFRTSDIEEVGDETHLTFFEMLGNFSFGGYFKEQAIKYAYDYFKEINLPIHYVTCFEGDSEVSKDEESAQIWASLGIKDIRFYSKEDNFWGPTGGEGPCGPCTEIYVNDVEIWNLVFNQYYKDKSGKYTELKKLGVDTGMGLERLAVQLQGVSNIFETDLFSNLIGQMPSEMEEKNKRIVADHIRASSLLISDGVTPSNREAGYILRRLIRRSSNIIDNNIETLKLLIETVCEQYKDFYKEIDNKKIESQISEEIERFKKSLNEGKKEIQKLDKIDGSVAFRLYERFGLPYDVIVNIAPEKVENLSKQDFDKAFEQHREKSKKGAQKKFGGHGLILDTGELKASNKEEVEKVTRLHTATHLLQAGLRAVLGDSVRQMGSDINAERLRFDFSFDRKLTEEEVGQIELWINNAIKKELKVSYKEKSYEEGIKEGALFVERQTYPSFVKVYSVGEISKELCGGPHVDNTKEIGNVKIIKQESVSAGIRRIRAKIENEI